MRVALDNFLNKTKVTLAEENSMEQILLLKYLVPWYGLMSS
jgi:hypothetical protein